MRNETHYQSKKVLHLRFPERRVQTHVSRASVQSKLAYCPASSDFWDLRRKSWNTFQECVQAVKQSNDPQVHHRKTDAQEQLHESYLQV